MGELIPDTNWEQFYRFILQPKSSARRRLEEIEFKNFDTEVLAKDERLDANGNTITYDQSVRFRVESGYLTESTMRELLQWQLTDSATKKKYLDMLHAAHVDFLSITEVNPDPSRSGGGGGDDDDSILDTILDNYT